MEKHIPALVREQSDEAVDQMAGMFDTQDMGTIETQVADMLKADRNIQSALLQSYLDTVSFTMIHPTGIKSKIIWCLIS